jgi:hypothetical protein
MEQLLIEVSSSGTSAAIKEFVSHFDDATISVHEEHSDNYYEEMYGMDKESFEKNLNVGLAQAVLGVTKNWDELKAGLLEQIRNK